MTDLHIIQTVGSLRQSAGGPSRTVIALCAALAQREVPVDLFSPASPAADPDDDQMLSSDDRVRTTLVAVSRAPGLGGLKNTLRFGAALRERCQSLQHPLLHDNGLWRPLNHTVAGIARQLNIPLIITIHGMLEPWAMNHKAWKKRLAWNLYQRRDLESAAVLHATAEQEPERIAQGLAALFAMPDHQRTAMGERGRVLVKQRFNWPHIAQQMLSVYRWVLGQGERPDCVIRD